MSFCTCDNFYQDLQNRFVHFIGIQTVVHCVLVKGYRMSMECENCGQLPDGGTFQAIYQIWIKAKKMNLKTDFYLMWLHSILNGGTGLNLLLINMGYW